MSATKTAPDLRAVLQQALETLDHDPVSLAEVAAWIPRKVVAIAAIRAALDAPAAASGAGQQLTPLPGISADACNTSPITDVVTLLERWAKGEHHYSISVEDSGIGKLTLKHVLKGAEFWAPRLRKALGDVERVLYRLDVLENRYAALAAAPAAAQAQPESKRYRVKKDAGSSFARVIDTEEGREVQRFNVVRRPDDWESAQRLCKRLNQQHEAQKVGGAAGATGESNA
jgi:hypothetical protein